MQCFLSPTELQKHEPLTFVNAATLYLILDTYINNMDPSEVLQLPCNNLEQYCFHTEHLLKLERDAELQQAR